MEDNYILCGGYSQNRYKPYSSKAEGDFFVVALLYTLYGRVRSLKALPLLGFRFI